MDTVTAVGQASDDIPGVSQAKGVMSIAELAVGAGKWLSNGDNIIRVAYVILGGALVIGGLTVVVRPMVQSAAVAATKAIPIPV